MGGEASCFLMTASFSGEEISMVSAPAWVRRWLSLPGWSMSKRWASCLMTPTRYPRHLSSVITFSSRVVLPVPDFATNETAGVVMDASGTGGGFCYYAATDAARSRQPQGHRWAL